MTAMIALRATPNLEYDRSMERNCYDNTTHLGHALVSAVRIELKHAPRNLSRIGKPYRGAGRGAEP